MPESLDQLNYDTDPHAKCREFLTGLEYHEQFQDIYRTTYPDQKSYTWRTRDGKKRGRIDVAMA